MKHQWLAYVVVAFLSVGAGVAIAGVPNDVPVDTTIIAPETTEPVDQTPESTTTTVPATTVVPGTTEVTETTVAPTTTTPEETTTTTVAPLERSEVAVAVANGAGAQGAAGRAADQLETLGYVDVRIFDGSDVVDLTVVYYIEGFEDEAARMAEDFDLLPEFVAPIEDAPNVVNLEDEELLLYVGIDRG